jgi:HD-GYP domain-containing protein (c-di-GMP phosphodiesterase class II)
MAFIDSNGHKRIKRTDCKSESDKAFRNVANDNVILNTAGEENTRVNENDLSYGCETGRSHTESNANILMTLLFEKSQETEEHAERMAVISRSIGAKMNLPKKSLHDLFLLSILHDIGKIGISERILNKPGKLTKEEWMIMQKHSEIGYGLAKAYPEFAHIAEYILCHHERWDGKGYPLGLKGEQIPLASRIIAVADAYDAMISDRVYRKAMKKEEAVEEIKKNAGTQFDPEIVKIFLELI